MSKISKLIGMASKALDKNGSSQNAPGGSGSGDWRSMVRQAADAITGDGRQPQGPPAVYDDRSAPQPAYRAPAQGADRYPPPVVGGAAPASAALSPADRQAIARYDYLLQTADPHQVEQIHRDAFTRLTPEQRAHVQARMNAELPAHERPRSAEPGDLARTAARAEASRPGMLKGLLARVGGSGRGGSGMGRLAGGAAIGAGVGVLGAVAGGAILSTAAAPLLDAASGLDFDAIAGDLDVEGLTGGFEGVAGGVGGVGEQVSGFDLGGIGDFFGR